jgi:hypothetical protein
MKTRSVSPAEVLERARVETTFDVAFAAAALGYGQAGAYEAIRDGTWPTPVIRSGRYIRIPAGAVLRVLGISAEATP